MQTQRPGLVDLALGSRVAGRTAITSEVIVPTPRARVVDLAIYSDLDIVAVDNEDVRKYVTAIQEANAAQAALV